VFRQKPIAVVTFGSLLILISRLNSGRANAFKERTALTPQTYSIAS
jgi:hypothetical protein